MARHEINNSDDVIDLRDVIARIEELEDDKENRIGTTWDQLDQNELDQLNAFISECKDAGWGDEQWRGDWYPITAIRDSYFTDYARELLEDCGNLPKNIPHYIEIDWEATARNIRGDYASVEFDGVTYLVRC